MLDYVKTLGLLQICIKILQFHPAVYSSLSGAPDNLSVLCEVLICVEAEKGNFTRFRKLSNVRSSAPTQSASRTPQPWCACTTSIAIQFNFAGCWMQPLQPALRKHKLRVRSAGCGPLPPALRKHEWVLLGTGRPDAAKWVWSRTTHTILTCMCIQ